MAGRCTYPWPILALLAALAFAPLAVATPDPDILRLSPAPEGKSAAVLKADKIFTWTDGKELVYALAGNVTIQQDRLRIRAARAVVWIDAENYRKRQPTQLFVFADTVGGQKVVVDPTGSDPKELDKALLAFPTPAIGQYSGEIISTSIADSGQYRAALTARGRPVPPPKEPPPSPSEPAHSPAKRAQFVPGNPDVPDNAPPVKGATVIPAPVSETRNVWIVPRTTQPVNITPITTGKERAFAVTGGFKMIANFTTGPIQSLEVEADMAVIWKRDGDSGQTIDAMRTEEGAKDATGLELYLTGNVVMRFALSKDKGPLGTQIDHRTLRAERVYYDIDHHRAIAINADMEYARENVVNTGHIVAREIDQLSATEYTAFEAMLHASRLPSDPAFVVAMDRADVYQKPETIKRTIFGVPFRDRKTGEIIKESPEILEVEDLSLWLRDIPFFYLPYYRTNLKDPAGPFQGITFRQDRIFGFQTYATWDMLKLIGLTPLENEKWTLLTDYLTQRGPGLGSNYSRTSPTFLGMDAPYTTLVKAYGLYDRGEDQLGGPRNRFAAESVSRPIPLAASADVYSGRTG